MSLLGLGNQNIVLGRTEPYIPGLSNFVLTPSEQAYHGTIWGTTGSGKSYLIKGMYIQYFNHGHGVGIIDPHHDLAYGTLKYLVSKGIFRDPRAYEELIYLDWGNGWYVPFNFLATAGDPHDVSLNALDGMLRVWPELTQAPLFQTLFLSSVMALLAAELPITFLYQMLTDSAFRQLCLQRVSDPLVHLSFESFEQLRAGDQIQAAGSALRRAHLLSFSPFARYTLGAPDCWLQFRRWMDEGKSFIINLGNINDPETKRIIGAMLMVQIEQAALSRTDLLPEQRRPFTLFVDEWPSFAAQEKTIGTVLSQTRKYNLRLYLAAQSLAQISSERLSGALENCQVTINFGLGRGSAEVQAKHIGNVDPFAVKEEGLTETQHAQYLSVVEQFESWTQALQNLDSRMAYVKLRHRPAVRIKTLSMPDAEVDQVELEEVIATYRRLYQRSSDEMTTAIAKLSPPVVSVVNPVAAPAYTSLFNSGSITDDA